MSNDDQTQNLNTDELQEEIADEELDSVENEDEDFDVDDTQSEDNSQEDDAQEDGQDEQYDESAKGRKGGKRSKRNARNEGSRLNKEWEDTIIASKRVKREEQRRKLKRAMLIMLVFALIVTSIVYVMLLFIQENNVRITANSRAQDKAISLSLDNEYWTPYLNAKGPETLWDLSYNKVYGREILRTTDEVKTLLNAEEVQLGEMNGKDFICFTFMLKNIGQGAAIINYEMTLENDDHNMQNAVRVLWGESFKNDADRERTSTAVYAALSRNDRLQDTNINGGRTKEDGYIEYVAYPLGSDNSAFDLVEYESTLTGDLWWEAQDAGYVATTPFASAQHIFQRETTLEVGDIMYCYVCIWLEGSDFDCNDTVVGGYCKMQLNFVAS